MNFRGVLSREAANILVVLNGKLKGQGITVDIKAIDTMESLLRVARVFDDSELNDLANRLEIECQLSPASSITSPAASQAELVVPVSAPVAAKKTKTIIYRGQKVEVEI